MTVTLSVPLIPNQLAAGARVAFNGDVSKTTSEGGNSNRKQMRPPLRQYTVAISPDQSEEIQNIIMAVDLARFPVGMMDPINFKITDQLAEIQPDGLSAYIVRNWAPATGTKVSSSRIVLPVVASLVVRKNDVAMTSGSYDINNYGVLSFSPAVDPDNDEIRVDCQFYTSCCLMGTPTAQAFGITPDGVVQYQFSDMQLEEIFPEEFIELTTP